MHFLSTLGICINPNGDKEFVNFHLLMKIMKVDATIQPESDLTEQPVLFVVL